MAAILQFAIQGNVQEMLDNFDKVTAKAKNSMRDITKSSSEATDAFGLQSGMMIAAGGAIMDFLGGIIRSSPVANAILDMITNTLSMFVSVILLDNMPAILRFIEYLNDLFEAFDRLPQPIRETLSGLSIFVNTLERAEAFASWIGNMKKISTSFVDLGNRIDEFVNKVKKVLSTLSPITNGIFTGIISSAWNWGADLISNFIDGIMDMLPNLSNTLGNIGGMIGSGFDIFGGSSDWSKSDKTGSKGGYKTGGDTNITVTVTGNMIANSMDLNNIANDISNSIRNGIARGI